MTNLYLDVAGEIGARVCELSYCHGVKCNWMTKSLTMISDRSLRVEIKPLGPEFYDGTSGIALYLSYLYNRTGIEEFRLTAEGAINSALSRLKQIDSLNRFGFYTGKIGIAYVATRMGILLNDGDLSNRGLDILLELTKDLYQPHLIDVIDGNAGAIPPLLDLYTNVFHDEKILDLALYLGKELISRAVRKSNGWSWNYKEYPSSTAYNLTGFSHGAAGIGCSLLELYLKTEKQEFLYGMKQAFYYENRWFNKKFENWPDFRRISLNNNNNNNELSSKPFTYPIAWCHGAPGIGFSRLRAYDLLREKQFLDDCQYALNTAIGSIKEEKTVIVEPPDYSLCHGISGICEFLVYASQVLNDNSYLSIAHNISNRGIENYFQEDTQWPCGVPFGETPDFMLGLSGIGYFYLHLSDPKKIPSALIVIPNC